MQPWTLIGITYEDPARIPICWRNWAFELVSVEARIQQHQLARLVGGQG